MDESELLADAKYRNYVTAVEKALKAFEYSSEWADLISALGKLNKVLQSNARYRIIPKRLLIGKRLAQCTHPALPSGVHLKALETYDLIFRFIGPKLLCQDMFIYSAGLFPLLGNASMSVKPALLNLYEEHYLPLGEHLKPALTGLLQGILPGLEEGSDFYDRTATLLEQLCAGMVKSNFYGALWECVLTSTVVRLPAITFILSQIDRKVPISEQKYFFGNNKAVMVQAVCSAITDVVVLVQRSVLDLIMICFPIHNSGATPEELSQLLTASLNVLLRRDMSLNRRLFFWLLGTNNGKKPPPPPPLPLPDKTQPSHKRTDSVLTNDSLISNEDEVSEYFEMYSKLLLTQGLRKWIHDPPVDPYNMESKQRFLKPYRILISLLDKPEVSSPIIDEILVEVFLSLFTQCTRRTRRTHNPDNSATDVSNIEADDDEDFASWEMLQGDEKPMELIKTANLLFNSFEPHFMWDYIARKFELCCRHSVLKNTGQNFVTNNQSVANLSCTKLCMLVSFLLDIVTLETYQETPTEYLPQLLCKIIMTLTNYIAYLDLRDVHHALELCLKLLTKVQPSMVTSPELATRRITRPDGRAGEEEWPQALLRQLEGIEKGYEMIEHSHCEDLGKKLPAAASAKVKEMPKGKKQKEKEETRAEDEKEMDETSRLIEKGDGESDDDAGGVQSLDRLSSQPQKFSESNPPPTRLRRPVSLGSRQNSSSLLDETPDSSSDQPKHFDHRPPTASVASVANSESEKDSPPVFLMQACVQCFQTFFAKLIVKKILPNADIVKTSLAKVQVGEVVLSPEEEDPKDEAKDGEEKPDWSKKKEEDVQKKRKSRDKSPWQQANESVDEGRTRTDSALTSDQAAKKYLVDVTIECPSSAMLCQAFRTACNLLVDFACFPMYCNETVSASLLKAPKVKGSVLGLPDWLQNLVTACCFLRNFDVQAAAVSTVLELVALTKSVMTSSDHKLVLPNPPNSPRSAESGTVSVVLIPAISSKHLECLSYSSNFFQRVAVILWSHLGPQNPDHHSRSADLLHKLHNAAPDTYVCEDIICNSLVQSTTSVSLEAHNKFCLLWHLIRSQIRSSSPASKTRTFDRSLLVLLDSLEHPGSMIRSSTQNWLLEAINRGDIARLLEPILLVLLHPATARASVQFLGADAMRRKAMEEECREREQRMDSIENRIYSISSSEGGEIKYYVLKDGQQRFVMNASKQDPVFACTSVDDKMNLVTRSNLGLRFSQPSDFHYKPLSVTVNPMSMGTHGPSFSDTDSEVSGPATKDPGSSSERRLSQETSTSDRARTSISTKSKAKTERKLDSGSDSATPVPGSGSGSTDDLSVSDGYDEPSYVYNEEVDESVDDAVRSIVYSIVDKVILDLEEKEIDESEPVPSQRLPPASTPPSVKKIPQRMSGRAKVPLTPKSPAKAAEEFMLDDFEAVMSGMETEPASDSEVSWRYPQEYNYAFDEKRIRLLPESKLMALHPLQQHILLYVQVYDEEQILHVLTRLKSILHTCPRQFVCAMSSTNISSTNTPQLIKLQQLLARHKRCITGWDFYTKLEQEALLGFRSTTYLEVLIITCVYFMRSFYPQDGRASERDSLGNRDVQIASMEILQNVLHQLVDVVKDSGRGLATFISDLLGRCKVQKAVIYCLLASVYGSRKSKSSLVEKDKSIIQDVCPGLVQEGAQTFQIQLLDLVLTLIILEDHLIPLRDASIEAPTSPDPEWEYRNLKFQSQNSPVSFQKSERLACQGLLLTAVQSALKQQGNANMHRHWITLITDSLPYLEKGLPKLVIPLTAQICRNLESLSGLYSMQETPKNGDKEDIPPDHVISMLEGLTNICHFCLLESTSNLSSMTTRHALPSQASESEATPTTQIFSSLIGALTRDKTKGTAAPTGSNLSGPKAEARKGLLGMLPRIMASIARLWSVVQRCEARREEVLKRTQEAPTFTMGTPKAVRQQILELLSPIALHHSTNLLAAVGVVWSDGRKKHKQVKAKVLTQPSEDQLVLVQLVSAIKALPTDTLVQTLKIVLKTPPFTIRDKNQPGLEVSMLQFFYAYVQKMAMVPLRDAWPSILGLLRDGLQLNLSAPAQFLLLGILNEIVHKLVPFDERKDQRDVQEISQRLFEAANTIAASSLEQSTWLRRNVSVKISASHNQLSAELDASESSGDPASLVNGGGKEETSSAVTSPTGSSANAPSPQLSYSQYSVQALSLQAELLAPLLDVVYGSDEKEKVVPLLISIMHNVTPYLKNHSSLNMPSFRACTSLVSSLSDYQYTRKAWKKDAFDLLVDSAFFQMDASCIAGWRCIIDNLMTHDRTTFKDLMTRVATLQNASLSIFASREQEMEQRAQLLKRLSFTVLCSERDQYVRSLPDIQERLAESLRLGQSPVVLEQVFMFFRVLLLRVSPHHLTGLWPTMITEMVQVFLHMEEQLAKSMSQDSSKRSGLAGFFNLSSNGGNPLKGFLSLYLVASKFLDLALCLPSESLPQFQVYKWAFVGESDSGDSQTRFVPHIARVNKLLRAKKKQDASLNQTIMQRSSEGRPLLTMHHIRSIDELLPFFNTLCTMRQPNHTAPGAGTTGKAAFTVGGDDNRRAVNGLSGDAESIVMDTQESPAQAKMADDELIEHLVERDFLLIA